MISFILQFADDQGVSSSLLPSSSLQRQEQPICLLTMEQVGKNEGAFELCHVLRAFFDDIRSALKESYFLKEKGFKRIFDEYSEGVSYKQQFLDKNAFLVYYTGGFDGPGRGSIEKETPKESLQKAQYGYRNDAWVALDECMSELDYLLQQEDPLEDRKDLKKALRALTSAVEGYVGLARTEQGAVLEWYEDNVKYVGQLYSMCHTGKLVYMK